MPSNPTTPEPNPKVNEDLTFQALRQLQANPNLASANWPMPWG